MRQNGDSELTLYILPMTICFSIKIFHEKNQWNYSKHWQNMSEGSDSINAPLRVFIRSNYLKKPTSEVNYPEIVLPIIHQQKWSIIILSDTILSEASRQNVITEKKVNLTGSSSTGINFALGEELLQARSVWKRKRDGSLSQRLNAHRRKSSGCS